LFFEAVEHLKVNYLLRLEDKGSPVAVVVAKSTMTTAVVG
jgi:hypothetical protein